MSSTESDNLKAEPSGSQPVLMEMSFERDLPNLISIVAQSIVTQGLTVLRYVSAIENLRE